MRSSGLSWLAGGWGGCCSRRQLLPLPPDLLEAREVDPITIELEPGRTCKLDVFVFHSKAGLRAFENYCPHAGGPLNLLPDTFLAPDKEHLICSRHGARFKPEDGLCIHGPCAGKSLYKLPVDVGPDGVTVSEAALRELCRKSPSQLPLKSRAPKTHGV